MIERYLRKSKEIELFLERFMDPICPLTLKYPYVCNGCKDKYTCRKKQYRYDVKRAQEFADYRLVVPRTGINLTKEEFDILNRKIKDGLANSESIYHIVNNNDDINVSIPTVYRYINNSCYLLLEWIFHTL